LAIDTCKRAIVVPNSKTKKNYEHDEQLTPTSGMVDSLAIIDTCDAEYCRNNWLGSAADKKIVTLADEGHH